MKYFYTALLLFIFLTAAMQSYAQSNLWTPLTEDMVQMRSAGERWSNPDIFDLYQVDIDALHEALLLAPHESEIAVEDSYIELAFPIDGNNLRSYHIVEYSMMETGLARKFPHIRTYIGLDKLANSKIYINKTSDKIFAIIHENGKSIYLDPYYKNSGTYYAVYDAKNDNSEHAEFSCGVHEIIEGKIENTEINQEEHNAQMIRGKRGAPLKLREYRLAVSGTFEFTDYYGGTVEGAMDGIVTIVNRINSILEREVAVRLNLVSNNDLLIFTTADDDPFEDGNLGQMIDQNQTTVNSVIGSANYDIGHVFGRAFLQGLAQLGSVCGGGKARGGSVFNPPVGDPFVVSIVCHEMGHQFDASHTMYHCHNVNTSTSYEPGSGSTIMSYAGICGGGTNIVGEADDYYHANSLESIIRYTRTGQGSTCGTETDFGNTSPDPVLNYVGKPKIPVNTPFRLTGSASDAEDESLLTYNWEQYQSGHRNFQNDPWDLDQPELNEPLFRSVPPTSDPTRYFPALPRIVNGTSYLWEQLPDYERELKFRFNVRDNAPQNGGTSWADLTVRVIDNSASGRFQFTNFINPQTIEAGGYTELRWNVAATDTAPFNTHFVDIFMSTDGGLTFPHLVKEHAKNDGSTFVNVPNIPTSSMRFMMVASNSIYLNVTRRSSSIETPAEASIGVNYDDQHYQICAPDVVFFDIDAYGLAGYDSTATFTFVGDLPDAGRISFTKSEINMGETTSMKLDVRETMVSGTHELTFMVTGIGVDTLYRTIEIDVVSNDFESLTLDAPVDGSVGQAFVPSFSWSPAIDAESYTFELAEDASFNTVLHRQENIDETTLDLPVQLVAGGVYFWRIKPINACGELDINKVSAFQVQTLSCEEYCSDEDPKVLSSTGMNEVQMLINTGASITVNDFNVTEITGNHNDMGHVVFKVQGPDGTEVDMFGPNVCSYISASINMGFDDDAAPGTLDCLNFHEGLRFVPKSPLAALNNTTGSEFTLIMQDVRNGAGGVLNGWCFEVCGDISPEKPQLILADSIHMNQFETRTIDQSKLEVVHSQFGPGELNLTIVEIPQHGVLRLNGSVLSLGDNLTMQDVIEGNLDYLNQSPLYENDLFSFVVTDPGMGFLGTPTIDFIIGLSNTRNELPQGSDLMLFPNPTTDILTMSLVSDELAIEGVAIFNAMGQMILSEQNINTQEIKIETSNLSTGIYFAQIHAADYMITKRFVKR